MKAVLLARSVLGLVPLTLGLLAACGSTDGVDGAGESSSGAGNDAAISNPATGVDSGGGEKPSEGGTPSDASTDQSSGDGAVTDPLAPHPPAGAVPCGSDVLSAADVVASCEQFNAVFPLPPSGISDLTPQCSLLTTSGAVVQSFCTPNEIYVHVRFDEVAAPTTLCGSSTARVELNQVLSRTWTTTGASSRSDSVKAVSGASVRITKGTVVLDTLVPFNAPFHGAASIRFGIVGISTCTPPGTKPYPLVLGAASTSIIVP